MRTLSDTITRLAGMRGLAPAAGLGAGADRLADLSGFGDNPGALRARRYVPAALPASAPLVVVLHGCTQTAAGYDHGSGWSRLADRHGFALLFPEQQRANNANLCFNWFEPGDSGRGRGEPLSIRNMVVRMIAEYRLDPARVFVTGLSAGGAMTATMLATYPDIFAGGAVIAGLPYASAATVPEAFDRMRGHGGPARDQLAARLRAAADHAGRPPILSVWHGTADTTVAPGNADAILAQWRDLHWLPDRATRTEMLGRHVHRLWCDPAGHAVLEEYRIDGMGHGIPLDPGAGTDHGAQGAYMLDAGIASSHLILRFWGLETGAAAIDPEALSATATDPADHHPHPAAAAPAMFGEGPIGDVITDALRRAGLMR